jgi:hypothetical protein
MGDDMESTRKMPSFNFKPDEALRIFKPILPKDVANELEKAIKNGVANEPLWVKVQSIIREYMAKVYSGSIDGEQTLWMHNVEKGFLHKEVIEKWVITNFRAAKYSLQAKHHFDVGLAVADTVVMNQHRSSSGRRIGIFSGRSGHFFGGSSYSLSKSKSLTYGDLVFFFGGHEVLRFSGISDPHGVRRMIETVKKQQKANIS